MNTPKFGLPWVGWVKCVAEDGEDSLKTYRAFVKETARFAIARCSKEGGDK